jgi:hypothetical protein
VIQPNARPKRCRANTSIEQSHQMELHTGWRTATERDGSFESGPSARFWSVNIVDNGPLWFAKRASPDRVIHAIGGLH